MTFEELARIDRALAEVDAIIEESLARKQTLQDLDLKKALVRFQLKVLKRKSALKRPGKQ